MPTTLDQTSLARDGGGDSGGSGGRRFRLTNRRRKVSPLGSARYTSSRRRLAAFTASSHAECSYGLCLLCLFSVQKRGNMIIRLVIGPKDTTTGHSLRNVGGFSCVFLGFLILVIRRLRLLKIGKPTNLSLRLQRCPIQTPKWHAVNIFSNQSKFIMIVLIDLIKTLQN